MSVRLYVGNLSEEATSPALQEMFGVLGEGVSAKVVSDRKTNKCRGFGFVTVETDELAQQCIEKFNGQDFEGSTLKVEVAQSKAKEGGEGAAAAKVTGKGGGKRRSGGRSGGSTTSSGGSTGPDPRWANQLQRIKEQLQSAKV
ncbi:MAG: RNA-binding protein [Cyanobacteria bacterium J06639_1]